MEHNAHMCVGFLCECVCFLAWCPVDRYWWMWTACSLSVSSPQHWSLLGDLWSPGADPQPNYMGGAQLDWAPIHLSHSTQAQTQRGGLGAFNFSTSVNAGYCQGHKSPEETEWKCSHKLPGLNLTSEQWTRCSPSTARKMPCQQMMNGRQSQMGDSDMLRVKMKPQVRDLIFMLLRKAKVAWIMTRANQSLQSGTDIK